MPVIERVATLPSDPTLQGRPLREQRLQLPTSTHGPERLDPSTLVELDRLLERAEVVLTGHLWSG